MCLSCEARSKVRGTLAHTRFQLRFQISNQQRKEGKVMADENIFSGLKVVDLASFIAGPGAATILSDYGPDVIKVEPPRSAHPHRHTFHLPPQPRSTANYTSHLN